MIETHVHILPEVDDGASSLETSMKMLEMAAKDGVTHMVVTPHLNHACSKYDYDDLHRFYETWVLKAKEAYPEITFRFGVEVYIDDNFTRDLANMTNMPTFENSNYMLIEFKRDTKLETMLSVVYELKLRGITPILAHVEHYLDLLISPQKVKELCQEGALIQFSASSLLDKRGQRFFEKLIQLNAIDLVASDGHDISRRQPVMREAYHYVKKIASAEWANLLFEQTPRKIFDGAPYIRQYLLVTPKKRYYAAVTMTLCFGLVLLFTGTSMINSESSLPSSASSGGDLVSVAGTEETSGTVAMSTVATSVEDIDLTDEGVPTGQIATGQSTKTEPTTVRVLTYDDVTALYIQQLESLQNKYVADVERIFGDIQNAQNFVADEAKRKAAIEGYIEEVGRLEIICDREVYDVLYLFQNDLEAHKYPVAVIEQTRAKYHQIKEETKQKYLSNFK